ncbi:MAG: 16S rRNA (guanine(527)-N(7))-methyltransferase RsmG [Deltaproteobacteria bacterium]|nr:16S rRNA (guanine(527)-N(7))-methyltransferase RsmG [Deltaproteobacteria bacterium]
MSSDLASPIDELRQQAHLIGIDVDDSAARQFTIYIETLLFWRERLSLTGADSAEKVVRDHILDSLFVARFVATGSRVADVGSGAGFPGLPLAIVRPAAAFVLIESRRKRANFLREVVRRATIANVQIADERADSAALRFGQTFDVVTARALGSLSDFLAMAAPLLKSGGLAVAMKGPRTLTEDLPRTDAFELPERIRYKPIPAVDHLLVVFKRR